MTTTIETAREVLASHGFTINSWSGRYCIRRDIPPYGQRCPKGKGFHRDWKGFHASEVSLTWVRRLADALAMADSSTVASSDCAEAWKAERKAKISMDEARANHQRVQPYQMNRPGFTLSEQFDLGVAELKATGAARVAQLCREVLVEGWKVWHPTSETIAAIDRGRQPAAIA